MEMTDKQRRWWFANHPEYSRSREGTGKQGKTGKKENSKKIDPKQVDKYVDNALKHVSGPVAEILKSTKRNFGTAAQPSLTTNFGGTEERIRRRGAPLEPDPYSVLDLMPANRRMAQAQTDNRTRSSSHTGAVEEPLDFYLDFTPIGRLIKAPAKVLKALIRSQARHTVLNAVKKTRRPARLPPKGTPEYKKIQKDRKDGVDKKKAQERADIKAGGKGSGVWTKEELREIRKGGDFPDDAQWHHDPTVANRPDLAADPKSVRIIRGGRKAHLREGHDGDWRKPYEPKRDTGKDSD